MFFLADVFVDVRLFELYVFRASYANVIATNVLSYFLIHHLGSCAEDKYREPLFFTDGSDQETVMSTKPIDIVVKAFGTGGAKKTSPQFEFNKI